MSDPETVVVVGAGLTAAHAVESMREAGYDGRLIVYGAEPHPPYERPPMSKGYLLGNDELESAFPHPASWYEEKSVELHQATPVTAIDLDRREVHAGGRQQSFDRLLLATGATPRRLRMADDSGAPVAYLRTIEDSDQLSAAFGPDAKVVIVGGGWIGLEVASAARQAGSDVTVLEALDLPLLRVLGPEVAAVFADLHREHGVDLRVASEITGVAADGRRAVVHLGDGAKLEADLLVVGIGVSPATALAEAAGLDTDNGVLVDEYLQTSDPAVFAAGDVANAYHPLLQRRLRVEHWDNAIEQGKVVGRNLVGERVAYDRLPYFFTDQYDFGMEYVGHIGPDGYDEVVLRGDLAERTFTAFWLGGGSVLAGMHANDWDAIDAVRRIVGADHVDIETLRDPSVSLDEVTT